MLHLVIDFPKIVSISLWSWKTPEMVWGRPVELSPNPVTKGLAGEAGREEGGKAKSQKYSCSLLGRKVQGQGPQHILAEYTPILQTHCTPVLHSPGKPGLSEHRQCIWS